MQGPLLRVLVVTLGLILYPREEPCVEEWVDIVTEGIEEHDRLLSEARKPYTEMPFNDQAPQTDSKAQALMNLEVTLVKPREPKSSNAPDTFLAPEHLPRIYWEGKAENEYVESKDSVKSHFVAEPDTNPPQETLADYREEPATPRHEEHIKLDRVPSHRVANENREHIQTSWALTDAQRSTQGERPRAAVPPRPSKPMQSVMGREAEDYLWYIWTIFSALSLVHFLSKYLNCYSLKEFVEVWLQSNTPPMEHLSGRAPLPDSNTLHLFHARFVKVSHAKMWRTRAFLEGFIFDLLKVMRTTSEDSAGVVIEDFIQTESGIVVPFVPPEPYRFQCRLWSTSDDCKQGCGKINIVEKIERQNGCHCESSDTHDMVCLLHRQVEKLTGKHRTDVYSLLCMKNTTFLSKAKVTKWFKGTVRKAWEQISHKYEFELSFSKTDITGALVVQFRSGRKIHFTLNPVVKLDNTMAYLLTTPCSTNISDISWSMSLAKYEEHFLTQVCKTLPEDTCHNQVLEILAFLHQKQTALTGSSALKDFHLKNALIELLLSTDPSQWHPEDIHSRLRDLVMLMERRLRQRLLRHALTGKALAHYIELPTELSQTHSVNLFHPLVAKDCTYTKTLEHFQELLRNASLLIEDYTSESERCDSE